MNAKIDLVNILRQSDSFVVRDYSCVKLDEPEPIVAVVPADALFEIIEDAHKTNKHITVSPVGPPIIDWR